MRGKWHILLFVAAAGCAGMAGYCRHHAKLLTDQAELAQARSASSSASFVDTFSGEFVSSQLGQLDQRRQLIQQASHWQEGMLFALLGLVLLTFAGYTVRTVEAAVDDALLHDHPGVDPVPAPQRS